MGFCIFGNAVLMARHALAAGLASRVAIVDWDVHHGNGTEELVRGDPAFAYASLHQWPLYPGSGGPGSSAGNVLNVPLAAGSGDAEYRTAFRREVQPFVSRFEPDLVVVSAGFDAYRADALAGMDADSRRVPRPRRRLRSARAPRRGRARGGLCLGGAAGARRGSAGGLHERLAR